MRAVIWCYLDMFGPDRLARLILVDQSPFLTANPSWSRAEREAAEFALTPAQRHNPITLYDIANLDQAVANLAGPDGDAVTRAFVGGLSTNMVSEEEKAWATKRMLLLARALAARLLYNNTTQDWFDVIARIDLPTLLIGDQR
jgi:non-heme chloroperoxidase